MRVAATVFWALAALGCGGDEHPDTGYGAGLAVPATKNCVDACTRLADCAVHLCNEDTDSTRYSGLEDGLEFDCEFDCTDAQVAAIYTDDSWRCYFQTSCRKVFEDDACGVNANYTCN
jgi:hypothetical protein